MTMGGKGEIADVTPEKEFYECPTCGYGDGFHVAFNMAVHSQKGEIILICPNCHKRFRVGWPVAMDR